MTMKIDPHPLADRLAADWSAENPDATMTCFSCDLSFPVQYLSVDITRTPSLECPVCRYVPSEDACMYTLKRRAELRAQAAAQQAEAEPAPEENRGAPPGLDDVIGNPGAVAQIRSLLDDFRVRQAEVDGRKAKVAFPHTLLAGPGGVGKTMLAEIIAREIKRPLRLQMGQSLGTPARVAEVLLSLKAGDLLFIDEVAGLKPQAQETLYRALEDGILVPIIKAGNPVVPPIKLPAFTLIGATTDAWCLMPSFCQRFEVVHLGRLTNDELLEALGGVATKLGLSIKVEALAMLSERCLGTPRLAVQMLNRCVRTARTAGEKDITVAIVEKTAATWGIDRMGLDAVARKYLRCLEAAGGDPVRLNVLAAKLDGLSRRTVETRLEPDMVWLGLITKEATGRALTPAGRAFLAGNPG